MSRRILIGGSLAAVVALVGAATPGGRPVPQARASSFGPLPVVFEAAAPGGPLRFVARSPRSTVSIDRAGTIRLALREGSRRDAVAVRFPGAGPAHIALEQRLRGDSNYLIGAAPRRWRRHVPQFGAARFRRLYPGIDLVLHGTQAARLEYDFDVAAGADPGRIRIAFRGQRTMRIAGDGALVLRLGHGEIRQPRPRAWQTTAGRRVPVTVAYRLNADGVRLRVGRYDRTRPLVIDPQVVFASYLGGTGAEGCILVPGDDGSAFAVCGTDSSLPRVGGVQPAGGAEDVYVAKLDRTRRHIVYSTYLGGPGFDEGDYGVADRAGQLYVTGFAGAGFPTTGHAFDRSFNGDGDCCGGFFGDAFVAKLSADGSRLEYSTYLGGSSGERASSLAVDRDGSAVVAGFTGSADLPTTPGALDRTFGGGSGFFEGFPLDGYAAKLDPHGSRLVWSTYLGGSDDDSAYDVSLDGDGDAYLVGVTRSSDFRTTPRALQPAIATGDPPQDAFVTKVDPRGRLLWSTFLGGTAADRGGGVGVGRHGDVFVSGTTRGEFPVTPGAVQTTFGGQRDWFVAKLDRSGSALDWATYLGGSDLDGQLDAPLRVDRHGNADVVGMTASTDFPTTPDAFQAANAGVVDVAVAQFDGRGRLRFASYFGGSGVDDTSGSIPSVDRHGNLYVGAITTSVDLPTTRAVQPAFAGGDFDALLLEVALH